MVPGTILIRQKMHRLRRSFAKTWRNPRWRDMLLAFLHWLAGGSDVLSAAVSGDEALVLKLPPVSWMAPVSIPTEADPVEDDDDDPSDDDDIDEYEGEESFEGAQAAGQESHGAKLFIRARSVGEEEPYHFRAASDASG